MVKVNRVEVVGLFSDCLVTKCHTEDHKITENLCKCRIHLVLMNGGRLSKEQKTKGIVCLITIF